MPADIDLMRRVEGGYFPSGENRSHAKRVLLALAYFADLDGSNAVPARETIALHCRMSVSSVKRGLTKLREEGMIEPHESPKASRIPNDKRPNQYRLCIKKLVQMDPVQLRELPVEEAEAEGLPDPDGGSNRTPTKSMTKSTSSHLTSTTEVQSAREDHDHLDSITEAHTPSQIIGGDEENDDQDREGEDHPSSVTADSDPLSGHDVSSGSAPEPPSAPHDPPTSNHPSPSPDSPAEAHTAAESVEYQDVDQKRAKFGWRPPENAYEHARTIAPDVNTELVITEYWLWCHQKRIQPDASHWMKWITRRQQQYEDLVKEQERQKAVEERRNRSWAKKHGWDL